MEAISAGGNSSAIKLPPRLLIMKMILAHYHISFYGFGAALVGALIAAKAVLVIESTSLSKPFLAAVPYHKILYDTLVYTALALVFLFLEKLVESAHQEGSFRLAFFSMDQDDDIL